MNSLHCVGLGISLLSASAALAQAPASTPSPNYPVKSVRIVVGFAAGGGIDGIARFYAQRFTEAWRQSFVVENRPGAGGNIGTEFVAKAPPDGYTLLMTSVVHTMSGSLHAKLPFDAVRDFAPISTVAMTPNCIAVHPSVPVKTLRELVALAKARPGEISYASGGNGTPQHIGMELFHSMAGIKVQHVPYNGASPSTIAVLGGQLPVLSTSLPTALPHARAGKLRLLAVTTAKRTELAPDFPTVAEAAGLPGYEAVVWYGLFAPAGTPPAIVNNLGAEVDRLQQSSEIRNRLAALAYDLYRHTPAEFADLVRAEVAKWGKVIREIGAQVD